ncbi:hypothetical protein [Dactylosporangium salmoneum]|uniref:Secreted protein n=1 Tax=Dactylosporangium salmoneum TaxID=53361 RepID=A0ABP5SS82_9ACTN
MRIAPGWLELHGLLEAGRADEVVAWLRPLDEEHRAALALDLAAVPGRAPLWPTREHSTAYAAAAVGCAPTPAKAATLIDRHGWPGGDPDPGPAVAAGEHRALPWMPELARRLAARLPRVTPARGWALPAGLLRATGTPPPADARFLDGWIAHVRAETLPADPFTPTLLPLAFDRDAAASAHHFLPAVAECLRAGAIDHAPVLERCLANLLDDGQRPGVHQAFARLLDDLAPNPAAWLRLLRDGHGPAATRAQAALRATAGPVERAALLDASRVVLARPEKGLVRAQLAWLDRLARTAAPAERAALLEVVGVAAVHHDVTLQDEARAILARHGATPPAVVATTPSQPPPPWPSPAPRTMPEPIGSPNELAEEVVALDGGRGWDAVALERIAAALVRLRATDPEGLAAALSPVTGRLRGEIGAARHAQPPVREVGLLLGTALRVAAGECPDRTDALATLRFAPAAFAAENPYVKLHAVVALRLAELAVRLDTEPVPELLATPTRADGALDPAALEERLARLHRAGRRPWPHDLAQARYRAPAAAEATVRVHRLPSPPWRYYAEVSPSPGAPDPYGLTSVTPSPPPARDVHGAYWAALWPSVLPGRREVVAAYLLPAIAGATDRGFDADPRLLPLLAEVTGDAGPATATAVAYGLLCPNPVRQAAAVDALLLLPAAAAEAGARVARLAEAGVAPLSRVVPLLADVSAADPGVAWPLARGIVTTLLPADAPAPHPPRGLADVLTAAAAVVSTRPPGTVLPGLDRLAAGPGSTRLHVEARRLRDALQQAS